MARGRIHVAFLLAITSTAWGCGDDESGSDSGNQAGTSSAAGGASATGGVDSGEGCPTGQTLCGTVCVTLASDPLNCGSCANACGAAESCISGACVESTGGIAGYNDVNGALYFWSSTDQGAPPSGGPSPGGRTNLGILLNAAASGVRDVDPGIKIALHLDRCNQLGTSESFIDGARAQGVPFNVFAESCYTGTQGQPSDWEATFNSLASSYPDLELMVAEYGGEERAANDAVFNLPNNQGVGAFSFTPNLSGSTAEIYDQMAIDYASRL